jgi:predicted aldo/keto reductase-like oxidoreductase
MRRDEFPIVDKYTQKQVNSVLDKIKAEIENHCGLVKENHCRYCSYCNSVMGVREILKIIDKYKAESEGAE